MAILAATIVSVAKNQLGYLEKKDSNQLDEKTANAGKNNYTMYARDVGHGNGQYWCETFVHWCFMKAYGKQIGNELLLNQIASASTMTVKGAFANANRLVDLSQAQAGDIVWRKRDGGGHVGLVVGRQNGHIVTIEGNTTVGAAAGSAESYNGGGVAQNVDTNDTNWQWCGRPAYDGQGNVPSVSNYTGGAVSDSVANPSEATYTTGGDSASTSSSIGGFFSSLWNGISDAAKAVWNGVGEAFSNITLSLQDIALSTLNFVTQKYTIQYEEVETEVIKDTIMTVDSDTVLMGGSTNLLSYPTLVEAPFVVVKIGDYTFGKYTGGGGSLANQTVDFPNYVNGISIDKLSGQLNTYTIDIVYQITAGDDPNRLDRIFSTVQYGKIYISYGDYNAPTFIYKEEEAQITKISTNISFDSSRINYTITAVSTALLAASNTYEFKERTAKPSTVIKEVLLDSTYGLQEVFPGMQNSTNLTNKIIPTDDTEIEIEAKSGIDPLAYIQYLVTCMSASADGYTKGESSTALKNYTYSMVICDDNYNDDNMKGCYFKIVKVPTSSGAVSSSNVFDLDIGYPTDNQVMSFSVNSDDSWSLLYKYSESVDQPKYVYSIDSNGDLQANYSPNLMTSNSEYKMTEDQKTWWTNMTQFPVSASVTMKGLVRPAILMTYIRVNAIFYGQKHVSSGLYFITGQQDVINGSGYRTTLSLTRCAGDNDYIEKTKTIVKSVIPVGVEIETFTSTSEVGEGSLLSTLQNAYSGASSDSTASGQSTSGTEVTHGALAGNSGTALSSSAYSAQGGYATGNDVRIARIAAAMATEQGFGDAADTLIALKWETSLLLNLFEKWEDKFPAGATIDDFIFSGKNNEQNRANAKAKGLPINYDLSSICRFFATAAASAYLNCPGMNASFTYYRSGTANKAIVTPAMVAAVKEVLNGKRYTNANEQGCDFGKLECNGTVIEGRDKFKSAKKNNPELFIPGVTKLQVVWSDGSYGAKSTFVGFPANNTKFDCFAIK